jgi:hypothetical protein
MCQVLCSRLYWSHLYDCCARWLLPQEVAARVSKVVCRNGARRDIGIDPLAPQLIINRCLTHGATP